MVSFPYNTTSSYTTNGSADQTHQDNQGNAIAAIVLLASGLVGCTVALLALGRDFFQGKNPPTVCIGALVWVDFVGVFSTAVLVFNGIVKGADWLKGFPQCSVQVRQVYKTKKNSIAIEFGNVTTSPLKSYLRSLNIYPFK